MNYPEYAELMQNVESPEGMEFDLAVMWLHPDELPMGLVSIRDTDQKIIKIPQRVVNPYGNHGKSVPVVAFSRNAFSGKDWITDIILPSGIWSFPKGAFAGCSNLRNITIPLSIRKIPEGTFAGCVNLENVYYEGTLQEWQQVEIVHDRHEIEFGPLMSGSPVQRVLSERNVNVPGNEALFSANIHFRCAMEGVESCFRVRVGHSDVSGLFRLM